MIYQDIKLLHLYCGYCHSYVLPTLRPCCWYCGTSEEVTPNQNSAHCPSIFDHFRDQKMTHELKPTLQCLQYSTVSCDWYYIIIYYGVLNIHLLWLLKILAVDTPPEHLDCPNNRHRQYPTLHYGAPPLCLPFHCGLPPGELILQYC